MAVPQTAVAPYQRLKDVDVVMTINHPREVIGLGNMLILNPTATLPSGLSDTLDNDERKDGILSRKTDSATGAVFREYSNLDAVAVDYDADTAVYKKANSYFAQSEHSDRVAVLDYDPAKVYESLEAFWTFNWTFAILAESKVDDSAITLTNIFEANKDHFMVLQSNDLKDFDKLFGLNYTIALKHDVAEPMDAAFVGAIANKEVGSTTWKFKELAGITPENLTTQEMAGINNTHAIAYVRVSGHNRTSEGWVLSGEYIDSLHGILWVQTNIESSLEDLLQSNDKIPYDNEGISLLRAKVTQILQEAHEREIIATDDETGRGVYKVNAAPKSSQTKQDISKRHYEGLSFTFETSSAVHSVTVHGTVDSDTILV